MVKIKKNKKNSKKGNKAVRLLEQPLHVKAIFLLIVLSLGIYVLSDAPNILQSFSFESGNFLTGAVIGLAVEDDNSTEVEEIIGNETETIAPPEEVEDHVETPTGAIIGIQPIIEEDPITVAPPKEIIEINKDDDSCVFGR